MRYLILIAFFGFAQLAVAQTTAQELFDNAERAYDEGRFQNALTQYDAAIKADSKQKEWYKKRGDANLRLSQLKAAISDYNKAEKLGLKTAKLYMSRGAAYLSFERVDDAMKDFNLSISMDENSANAYFNRGSAHYLNMDLESAIKDYAKAIELNPEFADAYYFRGVAKGERETGRDNGISDIKKAVELDSTLTDAYLSMGIILVGRKEYADAVEILDKAVEIDSDYKATAFFYRGEAHYGLEKNEAACEDYLTSGNLGDEEAMATHVDICIRGKEKKPTRRRGNREVITF